MPKHAPLVIAGAGIAGLTAALYASRNGLNPVVLAGPLPGGLLSQTGTVENYPGFPEGIRGFELTELFKKQAMKFGTQILSASLLRADLDPLNGIHHLILDNREELTCKALIIASGCLQRWLGIPAEKKLLGKGVSSCAFCDGPFYRGVPVCVVGGGDTAMEDALFLAEMADQVYLIHRRHEFRASKILQERVLKHRKIKIYFEHIVEDISGENTVEGVRIRHIRSGRETFLKCSGYFSALGYIPNTAIFQKVLDLDEQGYIRTENRSSRCSCKGVFAAGDCADPHYRQAVTAAGSGCQAAIDAARFLWQEQ